MGSNSSLLRKLKFLSTHTTQERETLTTDAKGVMIKLQSAVELSSVNSARTTMRLRSIVKKTDETHSSVEQVTDASKKLFEKISEVAASASETLKSTEEVRNLTQVGHQVSERAVASGQQLQMHIHSTAERIDSLVQKVRQVTQLSQVIREISTQTRLLSFNAAIEAAKAGQFGAGFAVVAEEVRNLADNTARQTSEIESLLRAINQDLEPARTAILESRELADHAAKESAETGKIMREISALSSGTSDNVATITKSVLEQKDSCETMFSAVQQAAPAIESIREETDRVATDTAGLSVANEEVFVHVAGYSLGTNFHQALDDARELRDRTRALIEQSIANGETRFEDYFAFRYEEIKGPALRSLQRLFDVRKAAHFDPPKFHTGYDDKIDEALQSIEDEVKERNPRYTFAISIDLNSYVPHHNSSCSKDWTGVPEKDLAGNRTKRIFNDSSVLVRAARVGLSNKCVSLPSPTAYSDYQRAGAELSESKGAGETFLVQTYARDTGQVLALVSVPIFIRGKRWGSANIGWQVD